MRLIGRPFLFLRLPPSLRLVFCVLLEQRAPRRGMERGTKGDPPSASCYNQEVTENEETADARSRGMEGEATGANLQRLVLSLRGCSFFLPATPRLRPRGFFLLRHSYFFYMPLSICSSNPPPSARTGHGAPLFNLTFSILSLFFFPFLSRNRLTRKQPKQPFEKRATIRRQLSAIPLQSGYFSPVTSWRCLRPTIPRFALADLLRVVGDGNLILYEERFFTKRCRQRI